MAAMIRVGSRSLNLDQARSSTFARKGSKFKSQAGTDETVSRDCLMIVWGDGTAEYLRDAEALAAWDQIERSCPETMPNEWTPAAVRRHDLAELADVAKHLRIAADDGAGLDPVTAGYLGNRLESARLSIEAQSASAAHTHGD